MGKKITAGSHWDLSQTTLDLSANNSLAMSYPCKHEKSTKVIHKKTREYHEKTTPQEIFCQRNLHVSSCRAS
mgnify:CR=1 FL=1